MLSLARLSVWAPRETWIRPVDEWEGPKAKANEKEALRSLAFHLLERWETPPPLHAALSFTGSERSAGVSEAAHRAAFAFVRAQIAVGAGTSNLRDALQ